MAPKDLSLTPTTLSSAKSASLAGSRARALVRASLGLPEHQGNSTATVTHFYIGQIGAWEPEKQLARVVSIGRVDSLISRTVNLAHGPLVSGTSLLEGSVFRVELAAREVRRLEAEKQRLESRVSDLEREVGEFRPYVRTIRRLLGEYSAATERVQHITERLESRYNPSGALERARQLDALDAPIEEEREEIW